MTAPELPGPAQAHGPDARRAMALWFLDHAEDELVKGNRLQASEKAWAAVAQQLKAIAEQRGWIHESHYRNHDIAYYLDREYPEGLNLYLRVEGMDQRGHTNFYENGSDEERVRALVHEARRLVDDLEDLRHRPAQWYTIAEDDTDTQARIRRLTGTQYALPATSLGFINEARLREKQAKWGVPPSEDDEGED